MFLNDKEISALAEIDILTPFIGEKRRDINGVRAVSYGLSQCGYDIRLSPVQFSVLSERYAPFCPKTITSVQGYDLSLQHSDLGSFYELPPRSAGNGVSLERFSMPDDVGAIVTGKSTYAKLGVIANITPIEPGWNGYLTMNFINTSYSPVRLFAHEGIAQVMFFRCGKVNKPYTGPYQDQPGVVVLSKVGDV